jgi:molybdenum cofactor synthesis domain-containing protein
MIQPMRVAVLTVSDRCSRGEAEDASGPALVELAQSQLQAQVIATACVPDEMAPIGERLLHWARGEPRADLILTTGGTGLAPRDITPEATKRVLEREHPQLVQLIHLRCMTKTPRTFLSRGVAGTIGRTLVINLPGSKKGAVESLEAVLDVLEHAVTMVRGVETDHPR